MIVKKVLKKFFRKKYDVVEVFTPSQYAELTYIDRVKISKTINNNLDIPGMQLIVYGHSGGGKSTLSIIV